jgi:AcrR family transcriptional regulator
VGECKLSRIHPATQTRRRLLSRPERQASILTAAAAAFAHAGYAATSMEDVAAEAGVTKLILYRHFESKEDLYRAVLERVSARLGEEFLAGLNRADDAARRGFAVRSLLSVAREDPDAFRLLWVHAAREPQFADHVHAHHDRAVAAADFLIGERIADPVLRRWGTRAVVGALVEAVLAWLDTGLVERDDDFVDVTTRGLRAMYEAWAGR